MRHMYHISLVASAHHISEIMRRIYLIRGKGGMNDLGTYIVDAKHNSITSFYSYRMSK